MASHLRFLSHEQNIQNNFAFFLSQVFFSTKKENFNNVLHKPSHIRLSTLKVIPLTNKNSYIKPNKKKFISLLGFHEFNRKDEEDS